MFDTMGKYEHGCSNCGSLRTYVVKVEDNFIVQCLNCCFYSEAPSLREARLFFMMGVGQVEFSMIKKENIENESYEL